MLETSAKCAGLLDSVPGYNIVYIDVCHGSVADILEGIGVG